MDLYSAPESEFTYELVRDFVLEAERADLFSESLTFEAKERRERNNVAEAVAALANTDGGVVLVGVKDKGAAGEQRIVGVGPGEHDSLSSYLHQVIPEVKPEIIPVLMPSGDRLVLVLRVDSDLVPHPVTVNGRVMHRIPGHSVPADRQRILELAVRDRQAGDAERTLLAVEAAPWRPADLELWPGPAGPTVTGVTEGGRERPVGTLRVAGGLKLPSRILDRPWLGSAERQAAEAALNATPLMSTAEWLLAGWMVKEARATSLRLVTQPVPERGYLAQGGALIRLAGRTLSMVAGFRWKGGGTSLGGGLDLRPFYNTLAGAIATVSSTCERVAQAAGAAEPSDPLPWQAWLQPSAGHAVAEVVNLGNIRGLGTDPADVIAKFPEARPAGSGAAELDGLARAWLTYWLLDLGGYDFEETISGWGRPAFFGLPSQDQPGAAG
jgi:Putative DNA-binding domain